MCSQSQGARVPETTSILETHPQSRGEDRFDPACGTGEASENYICDVNSEANPGAVSASESYSSIAATVDAQLIQVSLLSAVVYTLIIRSMRGGTVGGWWMVWRTAGIRV